MKKRDTASNRSETGKISMKNKLKIVVTSALLLAATSASAIASIISLPASGRYLIIELTDVIIAGFSDDTFRISTNGLTGELTIQGSDFPPEYDVATTAKAVLPFDQHLELVIDVAKGTVSGRSTVNFADASSVYLAATAQVRGSASCLPLNGRECGQLIVDLELRGVLSDPNDPASVGQLQQWMLGSLIWDDTNVAHWAAMSANTTIGGNEGLINLVSEYARCNGALVIC